MLGTAEEMRACREKWEEKRRQAAAWRELFERDRRVLGTGCLLVHDDGRVEVVSHKLTPRPWCPALRRELFKMVVDNVTDRA